MLGLMNSVAGLGDGGQRHPGAILFTSWSGYLNRSVGRRTE